MFFKDLQNKLFQMSIRNKKYIMYFFAFVYFFIISITLVGGYFIVTKNPSSPFWYSLGIASGKAALVLLSIVVLPGMLGRFDIKFPITLIITRYRRQFGILVFLLALTHFSLVRLISNIENIVSYINTQPIFERLGSIALFLLFLLFITSNSWSVVKLKKWWKRLHRLIYVILWLVFAHVALQRVSVWTVWIGFIATLEMISLLYSFIKKRSI